MTSNHRSRRKHSVDPLDNAVRIKFSDTTISLPRLDSCAVENATMEHTDDDTESSSRHSPRNRSYSISQNADLQEALTEPGREPGVDVNNLELDIYHECQVLVVDYCKERYLIHGPFANEDFLKFMDRPKPEWSKIRWINVNGMSFDIMRKLSNSYSLHQLSVEDALHFPTRTKIDHYAEHSYVCLALLLLIEDEDSDAGSDTGTVSARQKILRWMSSDSKADASVTHLYRASEFQTTLREYHFPKSTYNRSVLQYGDSKAEVGIEQVSLFYTDGVVISMFEHSAELIARPILKRISAGSAMLLRSTEDIDLLVHALVDGIVDNCEAVIASYQEHLATLERGVLDNPKREHTRELHLFISDLSLLRKTLAPVITIVNDFRSNTQNAVVAKAAAPPAMTPGTALGGDPGQTGYFVPSASSVWSANSNRSGYWADVADHIYANSDNIDSMRTLSDNLINLIFNTLSSRQNDIMRSLTITTIVFLPLTFLTGYFGMNFKGTWGALEDGVIYFWKIAVPVTVFILLVIAGPPVWRIAKKHRKSSRPEIQQRRMRKPIKWKLRRRKTAKKPSFSNSLEPKEEQEQASQETFIRTPRRKCKHLFAALRANKIAAALTTIEGTTERISNCLQLRTGISRLLCKTLKIHYVKPESELVLPQQFEFEEFRSKLHKRAR